MRRIFTILLSLTLAACGSPTTQTASPDAVRAFYVGLAALQVGDDVRAKEEFTKATQLAPNEPAAWVNLGILQIRHKDFESAQKSLDRAKTLASDNPRIFETIALLERQRGAFDASQAALQKAIELDPNNLKAIYALAKEKERQLDDAAARSLYETVLRLKPGNLETLLEAIRLAAKQNDVDAVRRLFPEIKPSSDVWEPEVRTQFDALGSAVASGDMRTVLTQVSYFRNTLLRDPQFRASIDEVKYSDTTLGEPFVKPLVLQVPPSVPAPADTGLNFEQQSAGPAVWRRAIYLDGESAAITAAGGANETSIGDAKIPFAVENAFGIAVLDFDYDFKNDIALAGGKGFRIFRQADGWLDVSSQTKLSPEILNGNYSGTWVFDVESDGDLDLILGSQAGPPTVLQNNSDGTFALMQPFGAVNGVTQFAAADLDEDGDADAVLLDRARTLHLFLNERGGKFTRQDTSFKASGFTIGDGDNDGSLDVIVLQEQGSVARLGSDGDGGGWMTVPMINSTAGDASAVLFADLDNNGAGDIVLSGADSASVWLTSDGTNFNAQKNASGSVTSIADINNDGRLDLIGNRGVLLNKGTKNYNWQTVRPRAAKTTGDQRVNSFGVGGELELRAGLLLQKRLITEPVVHFGLGEQPAADVLRVVWQNGFVQAEFDIEPNQSIAAEQRLKGSCPHLFAFDGESFKLVKDAPPWSPALGLKINAQDTFGILETEEWFKIPGDALKPTAENFYELRITAEYWESFYIDHYSLRVVDHPEDTEVFADERFSVPPPALEVFTTNPTRAFAAARNDKGEDVSAVVHTLDEKYLDGFERGTFQGVARDHFVELELPPDAPKDKQIAIIADGWVHPTDASINVQLGQSNKEKPRSLSLEVRDEQGAWKLAKENLGFPAGKMKTVVIDLPAGARAARLRTNMEIFWDKLEWCVYETGDQNMTTRLELASSDLRYRGFSVIEKANDSSPEKPVYDQLLTTGQRWRDMEGYFTRFGDVSELLMKTDGRFVLANAGDEIVLKFPALSPPPAGYRRDFVLIGNGWIKDGDLNSVFSKTLLPLPRHETNDYSTRPTTLENDPVYRKHRPDWLNFHTRYVSPEGFMKALR